MIFEFRWIFCLSVAVADDVDEVAHDKCIYEFNARLSRQIDNKLKLYPISVSLLVGKQTTTTTTTITTAWYTYSSRIAAINCE